jgi:Effector protein
MALRISTKIYKGQTQLVDPVDNEAEGFELAVNKALERIRSTEVGSSLIGEIEGAGPEVLIVKAGTNVDNTCVQSPQTEQASDAACYEEVLNHETLGGKIQKLIYSGTIPKSHPAITKYMKFHYGSDYKTVIGKYTDVPLAHKEKNNRPHNTDVTLKNTIPYAEVLKNGGLIADGQSAIKVGFSSVCYLQNGLVGYHIMDHLTPGKGTGAWVVWDPSLEKVGQDLDQRAAWMDRPAWIALAHELIHGWRLASGRRVFRPCGVGGEYYYEEAMTVGLPPYDQCRFTENRLRRLKGLPLRTFYGQETRNQSDHAAEKHGSTKSRLKKLLPKIDKFLSIKIDGSSGDPLVFDYEIRSSGKPDEIISGKTDVKGSATAHWMSDGEIRMSGFGACGRVGTEWQKILVSRRMTLQFGRYSFICEKLFGKP